MTKESHQWYQETLTAKNGQIERLRAALESITRSVDYADAVTTAYAALANEQERK